MSEGKGRRHTDGLEQRQCTRTEEQDQIRLYPIVSDYLWAQPKGIIRELERRDEKEYLNKLGLQNIFTMGKEKHLET